MRRLVNSFILPFAIMGTLATAAEQPLSSHAVTKTQSSTTTDNDAYEHALLDFVLTDENFEAFRQVAVYRHSARLDILPGFPESPMLARSVQSVDSDAGTRERLTGVHLTARDYVLTAWALIVAHDPEQWGMTDERLTPSMRRNISFVQSHRASVHALLTQ